MKYTKSTLVVFVILVLFALNVESVFAQVGPPPPPPGLPIDGGLIYLVLSGICYGLYEIIRRR